MKKRLIIFICALFVCATVLPINITSLVAQDNVTAINADPYIWFKDKLDGHAVTFYKAFEELYSSGEMAKGTGSIDVTNKFQQAVLKKYANGDASFAKAFQEARDAFMQDHGEIFYVDFTKVTLRLGMQNTKYILLINNGSNANYYTDGFTSENQVNTAIASLNQVKNQIHSTITDNMKSNASTIVTAIHNALVERLDYTYPSKEDMQVSNIYGALINKRANCQGYSKSLKWLLEDYAIPSVLVSGMAINSLGNKESHMWNYVKIEGAWYAVDATWDDPITRTKDSASSIKTTYLLRGADTFNENHFPLGELSYGSKDFEYPKLSSLDFDQINSDIEIKDYNDLSTDLKIISTKQVGDDGFVSTAFTLNYKNMTLKQLEAKGLYLAGRYTNEKDIVQPWVPMNVYSNGATGNELFKMALSKAGHIQFCITDRNTDDTSYKEDLSAVGNNIVVSKVLKVAYTTNYTAPPFIRTSQPPLTSTIDPVKTHYKVEFNEKLILQDSSLPVTIKIYNSEAHINSEVKNITYSYSTYTLPGGEIKESTFVEFDYTPDTSYQGYLNIANLQIENMIGLESKKIPNTISIRTTYKVILPCPTQVAHGASPDAFVLASPVLVIDDEIDAFDYNGSINTGSLNISLIATRPSASEQKKLDDTLSETIGQSISNKKTATYDLTLGCKSIVAALRPGYHVTVAIPYPDGFDPRDYDDVEFKAYHFKKNNDGTYTTQEIVCQITPAGLIVIADDFSPFTIVAFDKGQAPDTQEAYKTVIASTETIGGTIKTNNSGAGLYAIKDNEKQDFTITADDGYVIDKILVDGKEVSLDKDATTYKTSFSYDKMSDESKVQAYFVAKTVLIQEAQQKIEAVTPVLTPEIKEEAEVIVTKTIINNDKKVSLKGSFVQDADLTISDIDNDAKAAFLNYSSTAKELTSMKLALTKGTTSNGMSLTIDVDSSYNGKNLTFVFYDTNTKSVVAKEVTVSDGKASVEIDSLIPFALLDKNVKVTNKDTLINLVERIEKLNREDYIITTLEGLDEKLEKANAVIANGNASEDDIKEITDTLIKAFLQLRLKPNKTLLEDLINKAEKINASLYTKESYAVLASALEEAKNVFNVEDVEQSNVDAKTNALDKALAGLKEIGEIVIPEETTKPEATIKPETVTKPEVSTNSETSKKSATKTGDDVTLGLFVSLITTSGIVTKVLTKKKKEN